MWWKANQEREYLLHFKFQICEMKEVWVIDDDRILGPLMVRFLTKIDPLIQPVWYEDAEVALEGLSKGLAHPQLILLDLFMPVLDGWQFLDEYAKTIAKPTSSRLYVLTSSIDPRDQERAEKHPLVDGFLSKPVSLEVMQPILKTV